MQIDPVVALMDEIERAYHSLSRARDGANWCATRGELARIAMLHDALRQTAPTTVIGAAMLLREAASMLPAAAAPDHAGRIRQLAARLDEGERRIEDLKWLRKIAGVLIKGHSGERGRAAAGLILLALKGATRPVLLWRAVAPPPRDPIASPRASLSLAR